MTKDDRPQNLLRRHGDRPAVIMAGSGESLTYAELDDRSTRLARVFDEAGLVPGDHVAIMPANEPAFFASSVYLSPAPLYHAAPLGWCAAAHRLGATVVVMERFDPAAALAAIERCGATHAQFVPTHFVRMLRLSDDERSAHDLSSLRKVVHAAAPCPVPVKHQMIDWLGPIVDEYYAGSEAFGVCLISAEEWLDHPGSVGRAMTGAAHITDENGHELPTGETGRLWFETKIRFEYNNNPEKTSSVLDDRGWATYGDIGRVDEDGFVYLTDRASNMIISSGVNIYPQEAENVLSVHPEVDDVAVLGVPDDDMGERVKAFVALRQPVADPDARASELIEYCRRELAHYKCPREVAFVDSLPRLDTGKLLKRRLLDEAI